VYALFAAIKIHTHTHTYIQPLHTLWRYLLVFVPSPSRGGLLLTSKQTPLNIVVPKYDPNAKQQQQQQEQPPSQQPAQPQQSQRPPEPKVKVVRPHRVVINPTSPLAASDDLADAPRALM
jgi:hypothetical protein